MGTDNNEQFSITTFLFSRKRLSIDINIETDPIQTRLPIRTYSWNNFYRQKKHTRIDRKKDNFQSSRLYITLNLHLRKNFLASICVCIIFSCHSPSRNLIFSLQLTRVHFLFLDDLIYYLIFFIVEQTSTFIASTFRFREAAQVSADAYVSSLSWRNFRFKLNLRCHRHSDRNDASLGSSLYVLLLHWSFPNHWNGGVRTYTQIERLSVRFNHVFCFSIALLLIHSIMPLSLFSAFLRSIFRFYFGFRSSSFSRLLHIPLAFC